MFDDTDYTFFDDSELLAHESAQRDEFLRLERLEPHLRDTTYRELRGSPALLTAYGRWKASSSAARHRGLAPCRSR
jgi:hypothetical protein